MSLCILNFELLGIPENVVLIHDSDEYKQASLMDITLTNKYVCKAKLDFLNSLTVNPLEHIE